MHVERDVDEVCRDRLADDVPLLVRRVLEQLLAEVVAEGIFMTDEASEGTEKYKRSSVLTGHEVREVAKGLAEDHIPVVRNTFLKLLLEIPTSVLVLAQARNLASQILKTSAREAID